VVNWNLFDRQMFYADLRSIKVYINILNCKYMLSNSTATFSSFLSWDNFSDDPCHFFFFGLLLGVRQQGFDSSAPSPPDLAGAEDPSSSRPLAS
jgi:hypothetical protein